MQTQTLITLSPVELKDLLAKAIAEALKEIQKSTIPLKSIKDATKTNDDIFNAPFWRPKTCAKALGVSLPTFWTWVKEGKLPAPTQKIGEKVSLWKKEDILSAIVIDKGSMSEAV